MKIFEWRKKTWYQRVIFALTIICIIELASHPELRLLLPAIDALGLDLLVLLISAQLLDYARPALYITHRSVLIPLSRRLYALLIFMLGIMGPYVAARVSITRLSYVTGA